VDALIDIDDARVGHCLTSLERHGFAVDEIYKTGWRDRIRDMPLIKAQAFRGGQLLADRPKDRLDVQNVLTVQGLPEPEYLREWAGRLGIADRLERAIADAGLDQHPP
jgi:hypothetical protein